jgi:ribosomal protein S18 acetylase RimI-like enzyme
MSVAAAPVSLVAGVTAQVEINPGTADDRSELFAFAKAAFGAESGWSDRRALDALFQDAVFVARVEGSVAGYAALRTDPETVRIEQLLVAPHHEGEGVGHRLLAYAEGYAISTGARAVQIVVEQDNEQAVGFYRRSGFVRVEEQLYELALPTF